jgi:hypothetical protein
MQVRRVLCLALLIGAVYPVTSAVAQPLGTFRWQLQPYCNVLSLQVVQQAGIFLIDGTDDQCGGAQLASVVGLAFQNPDGTIGFGLTVVTAPGATPVHIDASITVATVSGTWKDSAGNNGTFIFTPGAGTGGGPRPVLPGGIPPASITAIQIALGAIGAPQLAANSVSGANIINGSITAADILDAPRAAFVDGDQSLTLSTTDTVVRSVTLTAPTSGRIVVNASAELRAANAATIDLGRCSITTGTVLDFAALHRLGEEFGTPTTTTLHFSFSATRGFNVPAGAFTANLVCDAFTGTVELRDSSISAMFVPQ